MRSKFVTVRRPSSGCVSAIREFYRLDAAPETLYYALVLDQRESCLVSNDGDRLRGKTSERSTCYATRTIGRPSSFTYNILQNTYLYSLGE